MLDAELVNFTEKIPVATRLVKDAITDIAITNPKNLGDDFTKTIGSPRFMSSRLEALESSTN